MLSTLAQRSYRGAATHGPAVTVARALAESLFLNNTTSVVAGRFTLAMGSGRGMASWTRGSSSALSSGAVRPKVVYQGVFTQAEYLRAVGGSSVILSANAPANHANATTRGFTSFLSSSRVLRSNASTESKQQQQQQQQQQKQQQQQSSSEEEVKFRVVEEPNRQVAYWLFVVAGMIFLMVVAGGLTRLTRSGLSMTHWKFTGEKRPRTQEEWEEEFAKYKESPEYKLHNQHMTLEEFKFIYHMEYGHRSLGRSIGLVFTLPLLYFLFRGRVKLNQPIAKRLGVLLAMGGAQGLVGWWMVKSGLSGGSNEHKGRVSPYRLATHLVSAFVIYLFTLVTGLRAYYGKTEILKNGIRQRLGTPFMRKSAHALAMFALFTAFSGAFVAGNDAGKVYNSWPWMGAPGTLIPSDLIDPYLKPAWRNVFEHPTLVQFDHRMLAYATTTLAAMAFVGARTKAARSAIAALSPVAQKTVNRATGLAAGAVALQVALGITTLLREVPIDLAAYHQAGAMGVLTMAAYLMFVLNNPAVAMGRMAPAAIASVGTAAAAAITSLTVAKEQEEEEQAQQEEQEIQENQQ